MTYKIVCFDVDKTLLINPTTGLEYWVSVFAQCPDGHNANKEFMAAYQRKECTYDAWLARTLAYLQQHGMNRTIMERLASDQQPIMGVPETIETLRQNGMYLGIISETLSLTVETAFPRDTFHEVYAHQAVFAPNGLLERWVLSPYRQGHKAQGLIDIAKKRGVSLNETVFVGDGTNDIKALQTAGLGIAFVPENDAVRATADVCIEEPDMRYILPYVLD